MTNGDLKRFFPENNNEEAHDVTRLDSSAKLPARLLPQYVDDVVEGYYYNDKFYKEDSHTTEIVGEQGKLYVDLSTNDLYRWSGTQYTKVSGGGSSQPVLVATATEIANGLVTLSATLEENKQYMMIIHIVSGPVTLAYTVEFSTRTGESLPGMCEFVASSPQGSDTTYLVILYMLMQRPYNQLMAEGIDIGTAQPYDITADITAIEIYEI